MIKAVQQHYGRIDALVNNAGQGYDSMVENLIPLACINLRFGLRRSAASHATSYPDHESSKRRLNY